MPKPKKPTPTPEPTPTPPTPSGPLRWRPPILNDPIVFDVVGGIGTSKIWDAQGRDCIVRSVGKVTSRLILRNARSVVAEAGEVDINQPWANANERWGIYLQDCFGDVFFEGWDIHGLYINEGIDVGQTVPGTPTSPYPRSLTIQNCRITQIQDPAGSLHADCIQPWAGVDALRLDMVTMESQFQCMMLQANYNHLRSVDIQRTDMRGYGVQQEFMLKTTTGAVTAAGHPSNEGPVTFGEGVYVTKPVSSKAGSDFGHLDFGRVTSPTYQWGGSTTIPVSERPVLEMADGRKRLSWPNSIAPVVRGYVMEGPRPEGDWCPIGVPGLAYVSPGYA